MVQHTKLPGSTISLTANTFNYMFLRPWFHLSCSRLNLLSWLIQWLLQRRNVVLTSKDGSWLLWVTSSRDGKTKIAQWIPNQSISNDKNDFFIWNAGLNHFNKYMFGLILLLKLLFYFYYIYIYIIFYIFFNVFDDFILFFIFKLIFKNDKKSIKNDI